MRTSSTAPLDFDRAPGGFRNFLRRQTRRLFGIAMLAAVVFAVVALATWNTADPSLSHATGNVVTNAMGFPGAVFADLTMQFFGLAAIILLVAPVSWGVLLAAGRRIDRLRLRLPAWLASAFLAAAMAGCIARPPSWPLPSGLGGAIGDLVLTLPGNAYPTGLHALLVAVLLFVPAVWLVLFSARLVGNAARPEPEAADAEFDDEQDDDADGSLIVGAAAHLWLSLGAQFRRARHLVSPFAVLVRRIAARPAPGPAPMAGPRIEPEFVSHGGARPAIGPDLHEDEDDWIDAPAPDVTPAPRAESRVTAVAPRPRPAVRVRRDAPGASLAAGDFEMPSLDFLSEPKAVRRDASLSKDALEQNARLLEGVLEDFGVKGEIIQVRPGPVVTLYELEPAPGIKSSRVIGLADDIARSMSAIAARVAVVPGRNAIGIELPNATRETVYLRELLASEDFAKMKARLGLALGKTINGEPVIADLAKMPHLLVAGTTGSGKSVAINTMILSLLYRMTPEQCRLIMIDPKMLELSVYDGIPHLLTPVVTDPKKAVVALKWTVREMEDRYRKMSKVGVRNVDGFNQRVRQAEKKGEQITRTVQVGFDRDTGEAIYESESLDLEPMPHIVVIIDEMADLMMVAGKDIEGAIQRLAQMARAAGIHVIMATQRPSVDVITGTIKANFPTRISFQVTSKIDSRTILGEQGAEQLLGMGDMLYMAGGGRIQRVHGPFVSDEEVEEVVAHLKAQGVPQYLEAITADDGEDGDGDGAGGSGNLDQSDDPYDQAVAVVLRDGKVSTSYIQRRLGIGYNRAASIVERMEQEGVISAPNHAGKREILVPTEEDKM